MPDLRDPQFAIERETLKLILQHTPLVDRPCDQVTVDDFRHPIYRAVWEALGGPSGVLVGRTDPTWVTRMRDAATHPLVVSAITELGVEPIRTAKEPTDVYVRSFLYRLLELSVLRKVADVKSRLQRTDPSEPTGEYTRLYADLIALEQRRRDLRDKAVGG